MTTDRAAAVRSTRGGPRAGPQDWLVLTPELLERFLGDLEERGRIPGTIQVYRRNLGQLYRWLPPDKRVRRGTLHAWQEELLRKGYAPRTVNLCLSAANSLMEYCGRREFQTLAPLPPEEEAQPELTRAEYLRLLSVARQLGKERHYLLVKVFCAMGLTLQDLPLLTVQAVQSGQLHLGLPPPQPIPASLRGELLDYIWRSGIRDGPVFVTRDGRPISRSNVTGMIQSLCADAQVDRAKGTPRCLKKLYQATQAGIQADLTQLMEQAHERLLETEQLAIGWGQPGGEVSGF